MLITVQLQTYTHRPGRYCNFGKATTRQMQLQHEQMHTQEALLSESPVHQECRLGDDFLEAKPNSVPPPEKKKIWFGGGASLDKVNIHIHWVHAPLYCAWWCHGAAVTLAAQHYAIWSNLGIAGYDRQIRQLNEASSRLRFA